MSDPCPCGSGLTYERCCGPLLASTRLAQTALELMRSRYTANFYGNAEHLWRTWHPRTRPAQVTLDRDLTWTGLRIVQTEDGDAGQDSGVVEFVASYVGGSMRERSLFERRGGRWLYLDEQTSQAGA